MPTANMNTIDAYLPVVTIAYTSTVTAETHFVHSHFPTANHFVDTVQYLLYPLY